MRSGNVLWFLTALAILSLCAVSRAEPPSVQVALALSLPVEGCPCTYKPFGCHCGENGPEAGCGNQNCPVYNTKSQVQQAIDRAVARRLQCNPPARLPPQVFPVRGVPAFRAGGCSSGG